MQDSQMAHRPLEKSKLSDELKFRAWDPINSIMVYDFYVFNDAKVVTKEGTYTWGLENPNSNRIIASLKLKPTNEYMYDHVTRLPIMQWMGRKDIQGKDIYKNDIVEADLNWKGGRVGKEVFEIEYIDGCFYMDAWSSFEIARALETGEIKSLKVIGNSYQNKDLLNTERG